MEQGMYSAVDRGTALRVRVVSRTELGTNLAGKTRTLGFGWFDQTADAPILFRGRCLPYEYSGDSKDVAAERLRLIA